MSGKRGSNPRPSAWEADALPTELLPQVLFAMSKVVIIFAMCNEKSLKKFFVTVVGSFVRDENN